MTSKSFLTLEEAYKLVPPDVDLHIRNELAGWLSPQQVRLLMYLIAKQGDGTLAREPAKLSVMAFYQIDDTKKNPENALKHEANKQKWKNRAWMRHPGKKFIERLRRTLLKFYESPIGRRAEIKINIGSKHEHFALSVTPGVKPATFPEQSSLHHIEPGLDDKQFVFYVGNNNKGIRHVIENTPELRRIRDTHFRSEEDLKQYEYDDPILNEYREALELFLRRNESNQLTVVVSWLVERKFLEAMLQAVQKSDGLTAPQRKAQFSCYRLKHPQALMNFTILDYSDQRPSEVLFGFSRQSSGSPEAVFRSSDERIVREFDRSFDALVSSRLSMEISHLKHFDDLQKSWGDAQRIDPRFDPQKIDDLLREAKPGSEVRILTTLFGDRAAILRSVNRLLANGVHVKIVMMAPEMRVIKARFGRRQHRQPEDARKEIIAQLTAFEDIRSMSRPDGSGTLEVRTSEIVPFAFFVQSGNKILMGLMSPVSAYHEGPMIDVDTNSELGKELEKNWTGYWAIRNVHEMEQIEAKAEVGEKIWLFTPDLSNNDGKWTKFRKVVKENAARGVEYTILFPEWQVTGDQLQSFRELFPPGRGKNRRGLVEIALDDSDFSELIPDEKPVHIVIYNPERKNEKPADLYRENSMFLWKKLEGDEATSTLDRFTKLIDRHL